MNKHLITIKKDADALEAFDALERGDGDWKYPLLRQNDQESYYISCPLCGARGPIMSRAVKAVTA